MKLSEAIEFGLRMTARNVTKKEQEIIDETFLPYVLSKEAEGWSDEQILTGYFEKMDYLFGEKIE